MLLNSGSTSGVIVGGSGGVSKGAVKDFAHSQQQQQQKPAQVSQADRQTAEAITILRVNH